MLQYCKSLSGGVDMNYKYQQKNNLKLRMLCSGIIFVLFVIACAGVAMQKVQATALSYSVVFNSNGGSGTMESETMPAGATKKLIPNGFTRSGYTFEGWNTDANGAGTLYANEAEVQDLIKTPNANCSSEIILYAQWSEKNAVITYESSNAIGTVSPAQEQVAVINGVAKGAMAKAAAGCHFVSWTVNSGLNMNVIVCTQAQFIPEKDVSTGLYTNQRYLANFAPNTYYIKFNANGESGNMDKELMTYDESETLTDNAFVRKCCTFTGWNTSADGSGISYTEKQKIKNVISDPKDDGSSEVTLYAQWEENTVEITYRSADSSQGAVSRVADNIKALTGTPDGSKAVASTGYHFVDWVDDNGNIVSKDADFVPARLNSGSYDSIVYTAKFARDTVSTGTGSSSSSQSASLQQTGSSVPDDAGTSSSSSGQTVSQSVTTTEAISLTKAAASSKMESLPRTGDFMQTAICYVLFIFGALGISAIILYRKYVSR